MSPSDKPVSTSIGVRNQRKLDTRARIAAAALRLFSERGFEAVRTTEIAAAAGVTEKTVFNHFASKEDLVFSNEASFELALVDAVRSRGPEVSIIQAAKEFFLGLYSRFPSDPVRRKRAVVMAALIDRSPTLREREQTILRNCVSTLSEVIKNEASARDTDLRPWVAADAIIAVHRAAIAGYRRGLMNGEPAKALGARMQRSTSDAFSMLAEGFDSVQQLVKQSPKPHRPR